MSRIFTVSVASVYPHYVAKVEKKGRTKAELEQVVEWLTGYDAAALQRHLAQETTFEDFFAQARVNPKASAITGTICGVRVEQIDDPLMQKIRYLDKLVDELAKGKPMTKILRTWADRGPTGRSPRATSARRAANSGSPRTSAGSDTLAGQRHPDVEAIRHNQRLRLWSQAYRGVRDRPQRRRPLLPT